MRKSLPETGAPWESLKSEMEQLRENDVDWRNNRTGVYVFHGGDGVLQVAREAYALYSTENGLGMPAFPSLQKMEEDVLAMGLSLLNAPEDAAGSMTSGGSESIFMAVKTCRDHAKAMGKETAGAQIVAPQSVHPAFNKAAHYLGLEVVRVPVDGEYLSDPSAMEAAITERTILLVGSAPCYPYGLIDRIEALGKIALDRDLWLHVDACVGGYFTPFAKMNGVDLPAFDFTVPGVRSISADLHKYGYTAKPASTVFYRSKELFEHQPFEYDDWPCGHMYTPTATGTRPGGAIAAAWAVMNYLGVEGYRRIVSDIVQARQTLEAGIREIPELELYGKPQSGIIIFGSPDLSIFSIWGQMKERGWFTGVTTDPMAIHMLLQPGHLQAAPQYLADLKEAIAAVKDPGAATPEAKARYS